MSQKIGWITTVERLKNRRCYSTSFDRHDKYCHHHGMSSCINSFAKASGTWFACYSLRTHRPSTVQLLNKLTSSCRGQFTSQMLSRRNSGNNKRSTYSDYAANLWTSNHWVSIINGRTVSSQHWTRISVLLLKMQISQIIAYHRTSNKHSL